MLAICHTTAAMCTKFLSKRDNEPKLAVDWFDEVYGENRPESRNISLKTNPKRLT